MSSLWKGRQKMLEAFGKADATNSESIQSLDRLLKEGTRNLHHRVDTCVKSNEAAATQGKAVGESFHAFSGSTNQFGELNILGRVLQQLGEFTALSEELHQALDTELVRQVMVPLDAEVRDLQRAKSAKKSFEKARLEYDAATTKLASLKKSKNVKPEKIVQGEQEVQQAKGVMEAAGQNGAQLLVESNANAEQELVAKCCSFIDTYRTHYERGLRLCQSYNAALVEFRSHVDRRQQDLELNKSRAKNTMIKELHAATTGARDAYFGLPLNVVLEKEKGSTVPRLLVNAFNYLRKHCLEEEGLFRVSPAKQKLVELVQQIDNGKEPDWNVLQPDGALLAELIKHFFRELPEPLLTHKLYAEFLQANNISDEQDKLAEFNRLITLLPPQNHVLAAELCHFLADVASHSSKNKMGPANLATIFGPSLLVAPNYAPEKMGEEMALANLALVLLITKHDALFGTARFASPIRNRAVLPRPPSPRPEGWHGANASNPGAPPSPTPVHTPTQTSSPLTPSLSTSGRSIPRPPSPRPTASLPPVPQLASTPPTQSPRGGWRIAAPPPADAPPRDQSHT